MAWSTVGTVSISPTTDQALVGPVEVPATGGLRVRVQQLGLTPFQWGFGLLSFQSSNGLELGTIKVYPRSISSSYLLGAGMTVDDTSGTLIFEPRTWNLKWVQAGFSLSVVVLAYLAGTLPADRYTAPGFVGADGQLIPLVLSGTLGRLSF
jgi:hypothetical protein